MDHKDLREPLEFLEDKESLVQEARGVMQVLMAQKVNQVLGVYQVHRDPKDCVANQETQAVQAQMDQLEIKEKQVP